MRNEVMKAADRLIGSLADPTLRLGNYSIDFSKEPMLDAAFRSYTPPAEAMNSLKSDSRIPAEFSYKAFKEKAESLYGVRINEVESESDIDGVHAADRWNNDIRIARSYRGRNLTDAEMYAHLLHELGAGHDHAHSEEDAQLSAINLGKLYFPNKGAVRVLERDLDSMRRYGFE